MQIVKNYIAAEEKLRNCEKFYCYRRKSMKVARFSSQHFLATTISAYKVPKSDQNREGCIKVKNEKLDKLMQFNIYGEVADKGQFGICTT